ncbi:MAG: helix-turn-helix domain-containing protein [Candidatus Fimadaptatus sp.]
MINTKAVRHRMVDLDLNNSKLAEACGVSAPYMCSIVKGQKPLTLGIAFKMQKALGVSDDEFCFYFMQRDGDGL